MNLRRIIIAVILSSGLAATAIGQNACDEPVLGTNLHRVADWMTQFAFVDVFEPAPPWFSQNVPHDGTWNTGAPIATDAEGWVTSLAPGQAAATQLLSNQGGNYPAGQYICLYDGTGMLEFRGDASIASQQPGRIVVQLDPTPTGLTWVRLTSTDPADPLRNIRLIMPGYEATHAQQPFHPDFLESMRRYEVIRFMDWQRTNHSPLANWSDRTTPTSMSQATKNGVAAEHMVDLCNELGTDAWFCMPHLATDDFITQFATLVRDRLDPNLTIYIEHSNEVWNGDKSQHSYAKQQGLALGLDTVAWIAGLRYHAQRSGEIFQIWETVFGSTDRLVRVLGGWLGSPASNAEIMDWDNMYTKADVLATAAYFGFGLEPSVPELEAMTVEQLLDHVELLLDDPTYYANALITDNTAEAESRGLTHIAYEGGQSLVDFAQTGNATLTALFNDANRHPRMRGLYDTYLATWFSGSNGGLFMHYLHVRYFDGFGSWGAFERQTQGPDTAYKWLALREYAATHGPPGDINGDCAVNVPDLLLLLLNWGPCSACREDLNGDGVVNVPDLLEILSNWG